MKNMTTRQIAVWAIVLHSLGGVVAGLATIPELAKYVGFIAGIQFALTSASAGLARLSGVRTGTETANGSSQTTVIKPPKK